MTIAIAFGSYTFGTNDDITSWGEEHGIRVDSIVVAGRHGAIVSAAQHDPKTLTLSGSLIGTSDSDLQSKFDDLCEVLLDSDAGDQNLVLATGRYIKARVTKFSHSYPDGTIFATLDWSATLFCADPFRYSTTESTDTETVTGSPQSYTLANSGSVPVLPEVVFHANAGVAITSTSWNNTTTGEEFVYTATVSSTQRLIVDMGNFTVFNTGTTVDSGTTDASGNTGTTVVDAGQNFTSTVNPGDLFVNTTDGTWSIVSKVVSNTQLTLQDTGVTGNAKAFVVCAQDLDNFSGDFVRLDPGNNAMTATIQNCDIIATFTSRFYNA